MLRNYLKVAWRVLLRRKFFTFISLFGVSVTLLVLLVAAAFADNMFGARAPETRLDRSVGVFFGEMRGPNMARTASLGYRLLDQTVRDLPGAERVTIFTWAMGATAYVGGERLTPYLKRTDGQYWKVLDFRFLEGGPYTDDDERNANFVAVINEATRTRFFGGAPALGKTIEIDAQRFRVVGVVPNVPIFRLVPFADVYVPLSTSKGDAYKQDLLGDCVAVIVGRDRASLPGIRAAFQERLKRVELPDPKRFDTLTAYAETFFEAVARTLFDNRKVESVGNRLVIAIGVFMVLFMLLPAVNLVNINVSRILERASEIGVRKAFGASSRTLVLQFVVENVLLSAIGGALGLVLAFLTLQGVTASGIIPYARFTPSVPIFVYGFLLATFFGLVSGVYPAFKMSRLHPVEALRGRTR